MYKNNDKNNRAHLLSTQGPIQEVKSNDGY